MDAVRIPDGTTSIDMRAKGLQRVPDQVWAAATDMQNLDLSHNVLCTRAPCQLTAWTALQVWQEPFLLPQHSLCSAYHDRVDAYVGAVCLQRHVMMWQ